MQSRSKNISNLYLWTISVFFSIPLFCQQLPDSTIHLFYTGNLNCALDDCRCGDSLVGGFVRNLSAFADLREQYPQMVLVDAGDYLSSYTIPRANRLMLNLCARGNYDALNLGDQEFVETLIFLLNVNQVDNLELPFLSTNSVWNHSKIPVVQRIKFIDRNRVRIALVGIVHLQAFEFIRPGDVTIVSPEKTLGSYEKQLQEEAGLQILLFHGGWERAEALVHQFPWIDVVIVSHNQQQRFSRLGNTILAESGSEGEYIGHLQITHSARQWQFSNRFIAVKISTPPDPAAQTKVDAYYESLYK